MLVITYIVANIFASLFLLLTMIGSIAAKQIHLDIATVLSIIISYVFIGICISLSIAHPWLFLLYGFGTAGIMLLFLRPEREEIGIATITIIASFLFWPEMIALMIFNSLFHPKDSGESGD